MTLRHRSTAVCTPVFLMLAIQLPAQEAPSAGGSTVTGHVLCADTNAPAHFASVLLKSTAPHNGAADRLQQLEDAMKQAAASTGEPAKPLTAEQKQVLALTEKTMASQNKAEEQAADMRSAVRADIDGSFTITGVKPGTYYLHAVYNGYIDPVTQLSDQDFASTDPAIRARIALIPTVTVSGADAARADLRLARGAALSGRLLYEDGSPATGWTVSAIQPKSPEESAQLTAGANLQLSMSGAAEIPKTDDLGQYRIPALPAGEYAVRATFAPMNLNVVTLDASDDDFNPFGSGLDIAVYSGDTFTRADAKSFKLTEGESLSAVDIIIPASKLHTIAGHVVSKSDGRALNHGMLMITPKDVPIIPRMTEIRQDGSFQFKYVPNGIAYTIMVEMAEDTRPTAAASSTKNSPRTYVPKWEVVQEYGPAQITVTLGDADIDTLSIAVSPLSRTLPAQ